MRDQGALSGVGEHKVRTNRIYILLDRGKYGRWWDKRRSENIWCFFDWNWPLRLNVFLAARCQWHANCLPQYPFLKSVNLHVYEIFNLMYVDTNSFDILMSWIRKDSLSLFLWIRKRFHQMFWTQSQMPAGAKGNDGRICVCIVDVSNLRKRMRFGATLKRQYVGFSALLRIF